MVSEQDERVTMGVLLGKQLLLLPWSTGLFPLSHITSEPLPRKGGGGGLRVLPLFQKQECT